MFSVKKRSRSAEPFRCLHIERLLSSFRKKMSIAVYTQTNDNESVYYWSVVMGGVANWS